MSLRLCSENMAESNVSDWNKYIYKYIEIFVPVRQVRGSLGFISEEQTDASEPRKKVLRILKSR